MILKLACGISYRIQAYSPDIAPSGYHLFLSMQHALSNTHLKTDERDTEMGR
ncbi:hypothetical protein X777_05090 [Ooceraea biroi]|uniref:Uncharacterized protein n=1 Tax=Ooceraea biroi TaxID=2015173 RepID=A0A026WFA6_OOCBI|nr:hypothetical protein X777_05090 [Ooceraea biroi]